MSRLERKKRTDIIYETKGGLNVVFDNTMKNMWYINDAEYDYICEFSKDEELELFMGGDGSFSDLRKSMIIVDKLLKEMYENI